MAGGGGFFLLAALAFAQSVDDSQKQFLQGDYEKVISVTQKKVAAGAYQDEWRILLVKSLLATGRYDEAYNNAAAGAGDSYSLSLRLLVRQTALYQNKTAEAERQLVEMK